MARLTSMRSTRGDLSVPRGTPVRGALYDADAFGRFSESLARFLGTGKYLVGQTVIVIFWIILNSLAVLHHWDPYPFILLNLAFSTQAAYAAPLILLAQNRQDERDRGSIERDRQVAGTAPAATAVLPPELAPGPPGPNPAAARPGRAVLVHGAATTSRVWRQVMPLLTAAGLTVTVPDRPCSGD